MPRNRTAPPLRGVFYLVQVHPHLDPRRIKAGWTMDMSSRLKTYHTSSPEAEVLQAWPCPPDCERAAFRVIERAGLVAPRHERHEVFDISDPKRTLLYLDVFFAGIKAGLASADQVKKRFPREAPAPIPPPPPPTVIRRIPETKWQGGVTEQRPGYYQGAFSVGRRRYCTSGYDREEVGAALKALRHRVLSEAMANGAIPYNSW